MAWDSSLAEKANATPVVEDRMATVTFYESSFGVTETNADPYGFEGVKTAVDTYFQERWDRGTNAIKEYFNTTEVVSVGAILDEVTPLANSLIDGKGSNIVSNVSDKLSNIWDKMTDYRFWLEKLGEGSDLLVGDMLSDSGIQMALSQLVGIRESLSAVEGMVSIMEFINDILKELDPYLPMISITVDLALAFMSGGASAIKAKEDTKKLLMQKLALATAKLSKIVKTFLYKVTLEVPLWVVDCSKDVMSFLDVEDGYGTDIMWSKVFKTDDVYNELLQKSKTASFLRSTYKHNKEAISYGNNLLNLSMGTMNVGTALSVNDRLVKEWNRYQSIRAGKYMRGAVAASLDYIYRNPNNPNVNDYKQDEASETENDLATNTDTENSVVNWGILTIDLSGTTIYHKDFEAIFWGPTSIIASSKSMLTNL